MVLALAFAESLSVQRRIKFGLYQKKKKKIKDLGPYFISKGKGCFEKKKRNQSDKEKKEASERKKTAAAEAAEKRKTRSRTDYIFV